MAEATSGEPMLKRVRIEATSLFSMNGMLNQRMNTRPLALTSYVRRQTGVMPRTKMLVINSFPLMHEASPLAYVDVRKYVEIDDCGMRSNVVLQ